MEQDSADVAASTHGTNHFKNRSKKRKSAGKRFLQNAKGFGRKNSFGRGAELEQDEYNYFLEILEALGTLQDAEERSTMANNVYEQIQGKEIKTSSNQLSSRVLENLLGYTEEATFERLMEVFGENLRVVCCDKFASHVLQKMLFVAMLRCVGELQSETEAKFALGNKKRKLQIDDEMVFNLNHSAFGEGHRKTCGKFVKKMAKFLLNNLEEFVWDSFGNYVIRQCVLNLAGIAELKVTKRESSEQMKLIVPDKWFKLISEFSLRLLSWPQFPEFPYNEFTSVLLQNILMALKQSGDLFQLLQIGEKLLNESFLLVVNDDSVEKEDVEDKPKLPKVFQQDSSVRLLEVLLLVVDPEFLKDNLFKKLFQGKIAELSKTPATNFAVQKLLDTIFDKHILEHMFSELDDGLEGILQLGHTGVVAALANACNRLSCQQGKFIKLLLDALHCSEVSGEKLLTSILKLMPPEVAAKQESTSIHLHGSMILQAVLEFNKPIKIVTAILDTKNDRLVKIFTDPKGSFIVNAFVQSKFVGEKSREKIIRHLEGCFMDLALSSHGSRVLELLYEVAGPAQKEAIVRELSERVAQLNSKPWGAIVNRKLLIDTYRKNPSQWKRSFSFDSKKEKLFDKILEPSSETKKRKL
ncbi:nucleolar protein 9 [Toxorhynchites rutilus septentrionalis]|uniref:nucleolar protein 9 n=1 Tax=Toxorhynchites rutilus septentrionalis TaxID=329112 RepID=UPI0024796D91|nr:nucleolar protein 9 [Toxorhynchites rutilus septentrionalis]